MKLKEYSLFYLIRWFSSKCLVSDHNWVAMLIVSCYDNEHDPCHCCPVCSKWSNSGFQQHILYLYGFHISTIPLADIYLRSSQTILYSQMIRGDLSLISTFCYRYCFMETFPDFYKYHNTMTSTQTIATATVVLCRDVCTDKKVCIVNSKLPVALWLGSTMRHKDFSAVVVPGSPDCSGRSKYQLTYTVLQTQVLWVS